MLRPLPAALLLLAGCDGLSSGGAQLDDLARAGASCRTDADCCVVTDPCHQKAWVVGAGDYPRARELARDAADEGACSRCGPVPAVLLTCRDGACRGVATDAADADLAASHCGGASLDEWGIGGDTVLGCGDATP
jgi:hypothetical protein